MRHVIIGTGPAGVVAAEHLRKLDPDSEITMIGDEPEPPYSRMAIPYFLSKHIDERGTHLRRGDGHFERQRIDVVQDRVTAVNPNDNTLALQQGGSRNYDSLLIATGSHPLSPPIPGMDSPGVHHCWTLEDARRIAELAQPGSKVVLMGAGFIGCIILEALAARGTDLTVIEMQGHMVPRMLNATAGGMIKQWCEAKGVRVLTSTQVESIERGSGDTPLQVNLSDGAPLPARLVISATGVGPNVGLLQNSGVKVDQGILVNEHLETNIAGIYAAGDVAQGLDFSTGGYSVHAIQPTAADHGQIAASNMAGRERKYRGSVIMNVLATMGLISSSFGLWSGADGGDSVELCDPERFRYLNLQFADDRLVGANCLGVTEHVGVLRGLIQTRVPLGKWKSRLVQDPTRFMEAYVAATQAIGYNAHVV
ncbi:MAG: FAD-dependent oxidoreductase [Gammaproteobacteria bacterium]